MQRIQSKLTVFYEGPFWVGVYERIVDGEMEVCKITFGSEPKDYEVYAFLLQNWHQLRFKKHVQTNEKPKQVSPKRMQRMITKQLRERGVGTKSQQAIKQQQEEGKEERKKQTKLQREQAKRQRFLLKQAKKKQKHRGH
ncbi:hypothetical protein M2475_000576 [Breznakia sp. PF5-3]|uniref:YjdF family protein n=1 Tax=unclassified Breznakia TaxID=2623764 RepID=UPI0024070EED|nr:MULTISPECIES: YjdF family protein [unclassified Breznakia]MDF9824218.1 hypothetical protein [Breznakia sp. PM6-1]MDF9835016.1 hypothetical protein [Breznakia sp. PF5-3]MDF9837261.1 hypothetical protein [Breznakia sp. PFB2-8]MDF9859251.1 hypothetical protein [Breznakia sp. PH5-24]